MSSSADEKGDPEGGGRAPWERLANSKAAVWCKLDTGSDSGWHIKAEKRAADGFFLLLTDFVSVWTCIRSVAEIAADKERYAPRLRSDDDNVDIVLDLMEKVLSGRKSTHVIDKGEGEEDHLVIRSEMQVSHYTFKWEFHCVPLGSSEQQRRFIKDHVVLDLLAAIKEQAFMLKTQSSAIPSLSNAELREQFKAFDDGEEGGGGSSGSYTLKSALEDVVKSQAARKEPVVEEKASNVDVDGDDGDLFRDDFGSIGGGMMMEDLGGGAAPATQISSESVAPSDDCKHQQDDEPEVKQRPKKKRRKKAKKFV